MIGDGSSDTVFVVTNGRLQTARRENAFKVRHQVQHQIGIHAFASKNTHIPRIIGSHIARIFEGCPRGFQQDTVLRIHQLRLSGCDTEESSIKFIDVSYLPFGLDVIWVLNKFRTDSHRQQFLIAVKGNALSACQKIFPKRLYRIGLRETPRHPNDSYTKIILCHVAFPLYSGLSRVSFSGISDDCRLWLPSACDQRPNAASPHAVVSDLLWSLALRPGPAEIPPSV
ncbi:hypothetical protein ExPCM12_04098 [Escherichia coli]|nr:hypothetical protein ExPCM17_00422 [Escherichia coli]GCO12053.1 hypothetical protein ExPCM12_04098 [Escherichia coli]